MSDLIASSLTVSFGARPLFSDVSVTVDPGDRIALVGPNGAGKTTLLRVLAGTFSQTAGEVRIPDHLHLALHDQRPERSPALLKQWVSPERIVSLERELRRLEVEMADGDPAKLTEWEQVRGRYDQLGGEAWHTTVDSVLRGLGFNAGQFEQPLDTLSGGELTRASLARALASGPDILLLDEPTNHLDIDTIEWLQDHLESIAAGVVLVSHDRWFIEATCNSVIEIAHGRSRRFKGSFVEYRAQQALEAVTHQREVEKWAEEVSRLQRFVDRFGAGTRARQAQSRAKVLDRLREDVPAYADMRERRGVGFSLPKIEQPGRTVFDIRGMSLGFGELGEDGERTLLQPCDLVVERGEKIALIGPNGSGKSTLLHAIAAEAIPLMKQTEAYRGGEVRVGYGAKVRLLAQHDSELVDSQSMLGNMNLAGPGVGRTQAQNLLGLFGFTGDDAEKLVGMLSGGERRRLMMAMALTGADNVVLFDEPTNHLDIESREALEAALAEWAGTLVLISHDRALVEGVATRTVVLHEETLTTAVGGYEQARRMLAGEPEPPSQAQLAAERQAEARRGQQEPSRGGGGRQRQKHGRGAAAPSMTKTDGGEVGGAGAPSGDDAAAAAGGGRKVSRKGARNADGSTSPKKKVRRPATIEGEIEKLDVELAAVNERMLDPEVYTDAAKSAECLEQHTRLDRDIKARWAELERSLEVYG